MSIIKYFRFRQSPRWVRYPYLFLYVFVFENRLSIDRTNPLFVLRVSLTLNDHTLSQTTCTSTTTLAYCVLGTARLIRDKTFFRIEFILPTYRVNSLVFIRNDQKDEKWKNFCAKRYVGQYFIITIGEELLMTLKIIRLF